MVSGSLVGSRRTVRGVSVDCCLGANFRQHVDDEFRVCSVVSGQLGDDRARVKPDQARADPIGHELGVAAFRFGEHLPL